jgi:hypothetical protein
MANPRVSIVVPTFNGGPYLKLLLDSILRQSFTDFEVLLLDDCSVDDSWSVMEEYRNDPRFRLFRWNPNRGAHAGTFFLLGQMRGEFWCYPGADDILEPGFLEERVKALDANPNCALVHGQAHYIDQIGNPAAPQAPELDIPPVMPGSRALETLLQHNYINGPSVMVRSSLTRSVLPHFCGMMFNPMDWYLWILIAATGFDFAWDPRKLHSYRVHLSSNSLAPDRESLRKVEIRLAPLLALKKATHFSDLAMDAWARHGRQLFLLTLFRCWVVRRSPSYDPMWLRQALVAHGWSGRQRLTHAFLAHLPLILLAGWRERSVRSAQRFVTAGLAQINEPLFRRKTEDPI